LGKQVEDAQWSVEMMKMVDVHVKAMMEHAAGDAVASVRTFPLRGGSSVNYLMIIDSNSINIFTVR
jgi:hypothetical protein